MIRPLSPIERLRAASTPASGTSFFGSLAAPPRAGTVGGCPSGACSPQVGAAQAAKDAQASAFLGSVAGGGDAQFPPEFDIFCDNDTNCKGSDVCVNGVCKPATLHQRRGKYKLFDVSLVPARSGWGQPEIIRRSVGSGVAAGPESPLFRGLGGRDFGVSDPRAAAAASAPRRAASVGRGWGLSNTVGRGNTLGGGEGAFCDWSDWCAGGYHCSDSANGGTCIADAGTTGTGGTGPSTGVGLPDGEYCTFDLMCSSNTCQNFQCVPSSGGCVASAQCLAGEACVSFVCVPSPNSGCINSGNCGGTDVCVNSECVPATVATTGAAEAVCAAWGGDWDVANNVCTCPSGMSWDGADCIGAPDTAEAACQAGGGTWDGNSCQCVVSTQIFVNGNCEDGCFDAQGNPGLVDGDGNCIAADCGPGQGRGIQSGTCMDCAPNGFMADGVHCNVCPPGSQLNNATQQCDCISGDWNADATACVSGGTGPKPPPKHIEPAKCTGDQIAVINKDGIVTGCSDPPKKPTKTCPDGSVIDSKATCPGQKPEEKKGGGGDSSGMIIGIVALAGAAGLAYAMTMKKKKR